MPDLYPRCLHDACIPWVYPAIIRIIAEKGLSLVGNNRITAIAGMVKPGGTAADIGSDHAKLAVYMLENGIVSAMIISDINEGPYKSAKQAVKASIFRDKIGVRQGDGLQVLKTGEVDTVIMAGMGGDTIVHILDQGLDKSRSFAQFVIQPMSRPQAVRKFLAAQGWALLDEKIVQENERLFVIISTRPGNEPYQLSPLEMDIGPLVLKDFKLAPVKRYLYSWLKKYRSAAAGLEMAHRGELRVLKQEFEDKIKCLEEILIDS